MINSPTLSVLSTTPKTAKVPASPASAGAQQSFGSAFNIANQAAQKKGPIERQPTEKNQFNQESMESEAVQEQSVSRAGNLGRNDSTECVQDAAEQPVSEEAVEHVSDQSLDRDVTEKQTKASSSDAQMKDEQDAKEQESGKLLQVDGQSLAVEQSMTAAGDSNTAETVAGEEATDVVLSHTDTLATTTTETESEVAIPQSSADALKPSTEALESAEVVLSPATDQGVEPDGSQVDPIKADGVAQETVAEAPRENAEEIENITVSVSDESRLAMDETPEVLGNGEASSVAEDTVVDADAMQQKVDTSVKADAEAAIELEVRPADLAAQGSVEAKSDDLGEVEVKASNNLRWVMEQMSKKAEQAGGNNGVNQIAPEQGSLAASDLMDSLKDGELVLEGDKIELSKDVSDMLGGKKTLDQLMANLGSQLQATPSQAQSQSAVNALQNNLSSTRPDGAAAQLTMQSFPNSAEFPSEMAAKVSWVAKEGFKTAHIHLDPPELGSLTVKISVDHESNAHVSFVASSAQAKDALEGQMQRLREMLQQQGVELDTVDVEVSQGNGQAFGSGQSGDDAGQGGSGSGLGSAEDLMEGDDLENVGYVLPAEQGIDYYA